jgi:prepilin-type N-terminal cleavage/methylation domain-containing protein
MRIRARGFTLVELMITVAIVGVLALVAAVGYRKIVNASHTAEATHMIASIRGAQEHYKAETGHYLNLSKGLAYNQSTNHGMLYPHASMSSVTAPGAYKVAWGAACPSSACNVDWAVLQVTTDAPVMYGYTTVSGGAGVGPTQNVTMGGTAVAFPSSPLNDWYLVTAVGDVDGNGTFSTVLGTSFDNELRIDMDGE